MDMNQQLVQVINEMHSEILKLERENRALRGELQSNGQREAKEDESTGEEASKDDTWSLADSAEEATGPPTAFRRKVSASCALTLQEQKGNIMTVRRYSTSSSVSSLSGHKHHKTDKRNSSKGAPPAVTKPPAFPTDVQLNNKEKKVVAKLPSDCLTSNTSNKRRSFQEHVYKCRGKVKAVRFLLPLDMSLYSENQGSFTCPQNQNTRQLSTIMEKDM